MTNSSLEHQIGIINSWQPKRILVAGDFMLDHYIYGNAERLSPDAPVPVLAITKEEYKPGGSSNVALDLQALRCQAVCLGITGQDPASKKLRETLSGAGCDLSCLIKVKGRPTTLKQNFVGLAQHRHPQKMFRVDSEERAPIDNATVQKLISAAKNILPQLDAICIEDYNKGVLTTELCQALIRLGRRARIPVLVDPAAISDYSKYKGASCVTPNRVEAALGTGFKAGTADMAGLKRMAEKLLRDLKLEFSILTLDKQGILYLKRGGQAVHIPTVAREVYDVTGAGDMLLAVLAGALANGANWHNALELANSAAGLEVEKFGVVPIALEELLLNLVTRRQASAGKIRTPAELASELAAHRSAGRKIVFTNGCFDLLHAGHISLLRQARKLGDILVLAINSDASVRRVKGAPRPVLKLADRLMVLSELESVDYVVVFDQDTPLKLIKEIKPEILAKGQEYQASEVLGGKVVKQYGGKVVVLKHSHEQSTERILKQLVK